MSFCIYQPPTHDWKPLPRSVHCIKIATSVMSLKTYLLCVTKHGIETQGRSNEKQINTCITGCLYCVICSFLLLFSCLLIQD